MDSAEIEVDTVVFCEDVRKEENGKLFIIGVYVTDFVVPAFPTEITLIVHVQGNVKKAGHASISLIIEDDSGGVLFRQPAQMEAEWFLGRFAAASQFQVQVHKNTNLNFILNNGGKLHSLATRSVSSANS